MRHIASCLIGLAAGGIALAAPPPPEQLSFDTHVTRVASASKPARLTAQLYLPEAAVKPVPAMVILVSSGGVQVFRENFYAQQLAAAGIAGLVVDSFTPRGVRSTVNDQTLVTGYQVENDGFAALEVLRKDTRIDPNRIGVTGVSKGGRAALDAAMVVRQRWRGTGDLAFAIHVPIVPSCGSGHRLPRTTGRPIFFMLGERDDYTGAAPCVAYAEAIRRAGNPNVEVKTYPGASHGWESIGELRLLPKAENFSKCRVLLEDNGSVFVPEINRTLRAEEYDPWARSHCMYIGNTHSGGGTPALRQQGADDMIAFLKRHGF